MSKSIDKNFENLKAQMMRKKDMAKKQEEVIEITEIEEVEEKNRLEKVVSYETVEQPSAPKIIIKKQEKQDIPKRITYYLNNSTIKKIDKYSKAAGMGKSAFVQTLLDIALENLEIE